MMDESLHRLGLKLKFAYSVIGLVLGLSCILAGTILGVSGVAGSTNWTASLLGLSTNLSDATPGVIVFIVGIFMVLITRFKISHITTEKSWGGSKNGPYTHKENTIKYSIRRKD